MSTDYAITIGRDMLLMTLTLAAPVLLVGLAVGLIVAVFQAVTSVQEQALSIIPKMLAVSVILIALMPWMLSRILSYTTATFARIANIGG